jgi:hypothetical protein
MNSTSSDSIDFLDVAAATATVAGCLATLAALIGVIMHRNASFCAAFINFMCCCRKRSNRVASSLHLRRAGGVLAELGGVVVHPASGRASPPGAPVESGTVAGGAENTEVENIYIEPLELTGRPPYGGLFGEPRPPASSGPPPRPERTDPPNEPPVQAGPQANAPPVLQPVFSLISPQQHIELELLRPPLSGRSSAWAGRAKKTQARNESFKL